MFYDQFGDGITISKYLNIVISNFCRGVVLMIYVDDASLLVLCNSLLVMIQRANTHQTKKMSIQYKNDT